MKKLVPFMVGAALGALAGKVWWSAGPTVHLSLIADADGSLTAMQGEPPKGTGQYL